MSFNKLPPELLDEIFSHFIQPRWQPNDIHKTRHANPSPNRHDEIHPFDYLINIHRKVLTARLRSKTLRLRLVCQAFNSALLRLRFGTSCMGVVIYAHTTHTRTAADEILNADEKWRWSVARETQRLTVELSPGKSVRGNSLFFEDHQVYYKRSPDDPVTDLGIIQTRETAAMERAAEKLGAFLDAGRLAGVVGKMPKLQALSVTLPEDWVNLVDRQSTFDDPWGYAEFFKRKLNLRLELLERVRESVAGMLRCAPGKPSLTNLTYLKLTLPCAYDFVAVEEALPDEVAHRLRHVYLEYIDGTGEDGDAKDQHRSLHAPLSNIQSLYPNKEHNPALWKIVSRCTTLSSLGLAGTQRIEPPTSSWSAPGLKNIYMHRVALHSEQLVEMMAREVEAVDFGDVKLVSGGWDEVFGALLGSERLVDLSVKNLTYDEDGPSSSRASPNYSPPHTNGMIWTTSTPDKARLRELISAVQTRGGSALNPDDTCSTDDGPVDLDSDSDADMSWPQPMD